MNIHIQSLRGINPEQSIFVDQILLVVAVPDECESIVVSIEKDDENQILQIAGPETVSVSDIFPLDSENHRIVSHTIDLNSSIKCGGTVIVTATCTSDSDLHHSAPFTVVCCPMQDDLEVSITGGNDLPIVLDGCIDSEVVQISVSNPLGSDVVYSWTAIIGDNVVTGDDSLFSFEILPGQEGSIVLSVSIEGCQSLAKIWTFRAHPLQCPETMEIELSHNGNIVQPFAINPISYNLSAIGEYAIEVTNPPQDTGTSYTFNQNGGATEQDSASNTFQFTISENDNTQNIICSVQTACCPQIQEIVSLLLVSDSENDEVDRISGGEVIDVPETPQDGVVSDGEVVDEPDSDQALGTNNPTQNRNDGSPGTSTGSGHTESDGSDFDWCGFIYGSALGLLITATSLVYTAAAAESLTTLGFAATAYGIAAFLLALGRILCSWSGCRVAAIVVWVFMWASALGLILISTVFAWLVLVMFDLVSPPTFLPNVLVMLATVGFGIFAGWIVNWLWSNRCSVPSMWSWP